MNLNASGKSLNSKVGGTAFELLDEAYFLLKGNLFEILIWHLLGCVPFLLGIMFFVFRFSSFHSTEDDIIFWALLLLLLFGWKNFFQCLLCSRIMNIAARRDPVKLTFKNAAMIFSKQTIVQSLGLLLIVFVAAFPASAWILFFPVLLLPSFLYTSAVINAIEPQYSLYDFLKKTYEHISCGFLRLQGMVLIVTATSAVLTINIAVIIFSIPFLLKMFWGVDTEFTIAGGMSFSLFFNTTLWSMIFGLVWLIVDPFCRVIYVLRVFYGESIGKGWDIQAALRRLKSSAAKGALILVLLASALSIAAADSKTPTGGNSISAAQLEKRVHKTLSNLEFQWRQPHKVTKHDSWIHYYIKGALDYCGDKIASFFRYLGELFNFGKGKEPQRVNKMSSFKAFLLDIWHILKFLIPLLLTVIGAVIVWRKLRKRGDIGGNEVIIKATRPDLRSKDVSATELEEHEWLKLGSELLEKGDFKLALRAFYLGCISALAQRKLLLVRRYKTDYEYLSELRRRAHAVPQLIAVFEDNVGIFQRVWYGDYPIDRPMVEEYVKNSKIFFPEKEPSEQTQGVADA